MTGGNVRVPVIPETITVHLGPASSNAQNVTVPFADYIKNVASSEIYPTWSENAIRANILAQISFALNRVYTEYYRSRGYDFDITNSTAQDQSFVYGRDIFDNISAITDELFNDYISRQGAAEPLFAQYCNGTTVTCDGLSQWGSEALGRAGRTPYEILTYYYGNDIDIVKDAPIAGVSESYPGVSLRRGSSGNEVRQFQTKLNRIRENYPAIPFIRYANGFFGEETEDAVKAFQRIFSLTPDGIVGKATWYKIIQIYSAVKSLSELTSEGIPIEDITDYFPRALRKGDRGVGVSELQYLLAFVGEFVPFIPSPAVDGIFGDETERSVIAFQTYYGLEENGIVDAVTWEKLLSAYRGMLSSVPENYFLSNDYYFGTTLAVGSRNSYVERVQTYLNYLSQFYPEIPRVAVDGVFGVGTEEAVKAFQRIFDIEPTGRVAALTYGRLSGEYRRLMNEAEK